MNFLLYVGQYSNPGYQRRVDLGVFASLKEIQTLLSSVELCSLQPSTHDRTGESSFSTHRFLDGRYLFDVLSHATLQYDEVNGNEEEEFFTRRSWLDWGESLEVARQRGWVPVDSHVVDLIQTFFSVYEPSDRSPEAFFVAETNQPVTGLVRRCFGGGSLHGHAVDSSAVEELAAEEDVVFDSFGFEDFDYGVVFDWESDSVYDQPFGTEDSAEASSFDTLRWVSQSPASSSQEDARQEERERRRREREADVFETFLHANYVDNLRAVAERSVTVLDESLRTVLNHDTLEFSEPSLDDLTDMRERLTDQLRSLTVHQALLHSRVEGAYPELDSFVDATRRAMEGRISDLIRLIRSKTRSANMYDAGMI